MFFRKATLTSSLSLLCVLAAFSFVSATSVVIPSDDEMIIGARAIVRGQVVSVVSGLDRQRDIVFTYITLRVQQVFKGKISLGEIVIKEPGGVAGNRGSIVFGTPEFKTGEDVLLFLDTWADGSLRIHNWFLGKYSVITSERTGKLIVARDAANGNVSVVGRSQKGPITDRADYAQFSSMLRSRISATKAVAAQHEAKFFGNAAVRERPQEMTGGGLGPTQNFTFINPNRPPRWFEPDTNQPVIFRINPSGAPTGTIINDVVAAMNAWSVVSGSAMRISNGGTTGNCGLLVLDGENTVSFNNCDNYSPFSPSVGGCSGILAAAGIISYNPYQTRVVNGITFYRAIEANVSFNPYASCHFGNSCNVQEVATHELGHTLGVGHSLDSTATMYAYAHFDGRCASLRQDDSDSMRFIYPGSTVAPLTIVTTGLPAPQLGSFYSQTLVASGGVPGYIWNVFAGTLPAGLSLATSGVLSGTPTQAGTFSFNVMVRDSVNSVSTRGYTVQANLVCNYAVSPSTFSMFASGGSGAVTVTAPPGCVWSATNNNSWITIQSGSGNGIGTVTFSVASNPAPGLPRTGTIIVANQPVTITQNGQSVITTQGLQYYPLPSPIRLLDTRPGFGGCFNPGAPLGNNAVRTQTASGACSGIPANAKAIAGNATVVNNISSGSHWITLYPSDTPQPNASNLNFSDNQIVPNQFTVRLGADGAFKIYSHASTHFIVDISGYYAPPGAGGLYFHTLPMPVRLLDTRVGAAACNAPGVPLTGNGTRTLIAQGYCLGATVPPSAKAIAGNATVVNFISSGQHWITLYPFGAPLPNASNLNFIADQIVPNAFVVGLDSAGRFNIYSHAATDFIVDVAGYFSDQAVDINGQGLLYYGLPGPVRLLDTRAGFEGCDSPGQPIQTQVPRTENTRLNCNGLTIPTAAMAITGNLTVVNHLSNYGFGTLYPTSAEVPNVSNINYVPYEIRANCFITRLNAAGQFNIFTFSSTHVVIDVTGYFSP